MSGFTRARTRVYKDDSDKTVKARKCFINVIRGWDREKEKSCIEREMCIRDSITAGIFEKLVERSVLRNTFPPLRNSMEIIKNYVNT